MLDIEELKKLKLMPVVVINKVEDTLPLISALCEGGLNGAEITYRTSAAPEALKLAVENYPNALIGAGTVISAKQAKEAIGFGAKFIVSPGLSKEVYKVCKKHDVLYLPGIATATELMEAISWGLTTVKFFPAEEIGGLKAIKALSAPFPFMNFMPTGGINEKNVLDYLSFNKIVCCGGSFMTKGSKEEVLAKTKEAVKLVKGE